MVHEMRFAVLLILALAHSGAAAHEVMMTVSVDQQAILSSHVAAHSHHPASMKEASSLMRRGSVPHETLQVDASDAANPIAGNLSTDETFSSSQRRQNWRRSANDSGIPIPVNGYGIYKKDDYFLGIYTIVRYWKNYLKLCPDVPATSKPTAAGWCAKFKVHRDKKDGSYVIFSQGPDRDNFLQLCGGSNQPTSVHSALGWCEKLKLQGHSDGSYSIYSRNGGARHYLSMCGGQYCSSKQHSHGTCPQSQFVTSKRQAWGACERFFLRAYPEISSVS